MKNLYLKTLCVTISLKARQQVCLLINSTSCPTDRGARLKAVRFLLMCQLSCHCSISMMLQACLLLQHLPLLQEVIHKFFSYIILFFCYIFIRFRSGRVCLPKYPRFASFRQSIATRNLKINEEISHIRSK